MNRPLLARLAGSAVVATLALSGCGSTGDLSATAPARAATAPSFAAATAHGIELTDGWVSAASDLGGAGDMAGMDMGGDMSGHGADAAATAYARLTDTGTSGDALVAVSTPAARAVTLHNTTSSADGSAGTMVDVHAIAVPAGGRVTLAPGGYHVMLEGLKAPLKVGTKVTMTWTFRSGASLTTTFPVINPTDRPQNGR